MNAGFKYLRNLEYLDGLVLQDSELTDEGMEFIGQISSLTVLDLGNHHFITGTGVQALANLTELVKLNICACDPSFRLTGASLLPLVELAQEYSLERVLVYLP